MKQFETTQERIRTASDLTPYRRFIREELTPCRKEKGKYVCPICKSGERAGGDGAFSIDHDEIHGKCFSCGFYGDIFDLFAARDSVDLPTATRAVVARYGSIGIDAPYRQKTKSRSGKLPPYQPQTASEEISSSPFNQAGLSGAREYLDKCSAAIMGSEGQRYLNGRGITDETIARFHLGYDQRKRCVCVPFDQEYSYYDTRSTDPSISSRDSHWNPPTSTVCIDADDEDGRTRFVPVKKFNMPLFNADALYTDAPCFIVESTLCAVSIEQEGGKAVAICGTNGKNRLMKQVLSRRPTSPMLIVCMDNDEPGKKAADEIIADLAKAGLPVLQANISGDMKDPNELLVSDPAALRANIAAVHEQIRERAEAEERLQRQLEEQARAEYLAGNTTGLMEAFMRGIQASASTPAVPTGFPDLDRRLDGGLYEGLYILGAISSLGKTTFVHQMADQIAKGGHDVLYFSLEMGRFELIAKSISRLTYTISRSKDGTAALAKTTRGILAGKKWEKYTDEEKAVINEAAGVYDQDCASRFWIEEGIGDIGVEQIRDKVEKHVKYTGRRPVVIIDYIQIVAPPDVRASDKQNTDKNVLELKRLSRDQKIPIVCISSLNRDNYSAPISMTAFKESGSLEYGSDVLIGLQLEGMDYEEGEQDKAREKRIRTVRKQNEEKKSRGEPIRVELKILKNRNGVIGDPIPYLFTAKYNHFSEATAQFAPVDDVQTPWDVPNKAKKSRR